MRCQPQSGRTHQIRVHLTHIGHPIVADKLYSGRDRVTLGEIARTRPLAATPRNTADVTLIDRQALHAHRLRFRHPMTESELDLTAPLPEDMAQTLDALRAHRAV